MSRLVRAALLLSLCVCACKDEPAAEDDDDGGDEEPPQAPELELAVLELELSATQTGELEIPVTGLLPGARVEIDGQRWLPSSRAPAWLDDDTLHVPLGGAMVVGTHELSLVNRVGSAELPSEIVAISIVEGEPAPLSATLDDAIVGTGDRIIAHGQGPDAAFALLDLQSSSAQVWAGQWSAMPFALELPGVGAEAGSVDMTITSTDEGRIVVVAWALADGSAVQARVVPVDVYGVPIAEPGEPLELWRLDDPSASTLLDSPEFVRIEGVALLDRSVTIALDARRDAEQVHVGDHVLLSRWLAADGSIGAPSLLRGPGGQDLDLLAEARLWTPVGFDAALSLRVGLGFPWLLVLANNGLPGLEQPPTDELALSSSSTWMLGAEAAFGSRQVFALDTDAASPRVQVLRLNRWSTTAADVLEPLELVELPDWPQGTPRLATFDGVASLVIPIGSDADVLALRSTGAHTLVESIPELRCDELTLAVPSFDGIGDTLPLVCLRERELRRGFARSN